MSRSMEELLKSGRLIKRSNGSLELCRPKELPPDQPAELEAIVHGRAAQLVLKAGKEGIKAVKHRVHLEEEALDPEGGLGIE